MRALRRDVLHIRILSCWIPVRTLSTPRNQRFSPQASVETIENVVTLHELRNILEEGKGHKRFDSVLYHLISKTPLRYVSRVLDKWVKDGNPIGREDFSKVKACLRVSGQYAKALQFLEWLEANRRLDFNEHDYASHLDLIAKVYGLQTAERYIQCIPKSFRGEVIYRSLLAHCVASTNVKKTEEVFKKMRDLGFPLSVFTCDQLLLLYKRFDRRKITDVLELMDKENVKPSLLSFRILIDSKGSVNDMLGMEEVVESMKVAGVKPDLLIQSMIARFYISGGLEEKAGQVLKEMGGDNIRDNCKACDLLIPLYASLHRADDVVRVWKLCESNPRMNTCLAAIEAFGKLGHIEGAEKVFEIATNKWNRLSSKYYNALLNVYANHKLFSKGKELAKRMSDNGITSGPLTWDALVKLYVVAGEVEKADLILHEAAHKAQDRPLFNSYMVILSKYSSKGDINNAEKIFERMKQNGYVGRVSTYQLLLQAYIHAKVPAYGFRERLKAENLIPNRVMEVQLAAVDPFKKTRALDLLH